MNNAPAASAAHQTRKYYILIGIALLALALGIYQWIELIQIRTGGSAPLCTLSAKINCATVWNSPLADKVHDLTGIPFAGWGVAWAAIVLLIGIELIILARKGNPLGTAILALRLTTGFGVITALTLFIYSIGIGVICPTCFLFYILVVAAAIIAFRGHKAGGGQWNHALLQSAGLLLILLAVLLFPGRNTPQQSQDLATLNPLGKTATDTKPGEDPLAKFLLTLSPEARQLVSDARAVYRAAPLIDRPVDINRLITGNARSPVHLIDWIDIRCPHCKHLEEALTEIRHPRQQLERRRTSFPPRQRMQSQHDPFRRNPCRLPCRQDVNLPGRVSQRTSGTRHIFPETGTSRYRGHVGNSRCHTETTQKPGIMRQFPSDG